MPNKKLKFQEAMTRLDEIVTKLSSNDLDLDLEEAMDLFTEGLKLSTQCEKQLKEFETKIEAITHQEAQDGTAE